MKVWIATDWYGTMVFATKPKWIDNGNGTKEWYGHRCPEYENLLPKNFKQKKGECREANIELIL